VRSWGFEDLGIWGFGDLGIWGFEDLGIWGFVAIIDFERLLFIFFLDRVFIQKSRINK
jgi:hypothetical protein